MSKILFYGDSITDSNRNYDAPVGHFEQLGDGYVRNINVKLYKEFGNKHCVINKGVNGNRIDDLKRRLKSDVLNQKVDEVYIMIGINDVWRYYDTYIDSMHHIDIETYQQTYQEIIDILKKQKIEVTLISPFFLEINKEHPMRKQLDAYNEVVYHLSKTNKVGYIDVQTQMDKFLETNDSYMISGDRVHLNFLGNYLLSEMIYEGMKK
ncbi:MAG TPA: GDSL-type esterase/lipase family protein [Erysipelothrix sp.]|nr:GDSL-type esterase/lipase family protein [Erysipelothrix sp.]